MKVVITKGFVEPEWDTFVGSYDELTKDSEYEEEITEEDIYEMPDELIKEYFDLISQIVELERRVSEIKHMAIEKYEERNN